MNESDIIDLKFIFDENFVLECTLWLWLFSVGNVLIIQNESQISGNYNSGIEVNDSHKNKS